MKYFLTAVLVIAFVFSAQAQTEGFAGRPITNNLVMQTGNTLHDGEFSVGIGPVEYGITENVQIGTNLLLFIFQYYNANVKVSFINTENQAFAAGLGLGYWNANAILGTGDLNILSLSPFISYTTAVGPKTRLHLSGNYTYFELDGGIDDIEVSSTSTGTSIAVGAEHSISNKMKFLGEAGYDIDFEGLRIGGGLLWGWEEFRLKVGLQYFTAGNGFVFPVLGLWWRFE